MQHNNMNHEQVKDTILDAFIKGELEKAREFVVQNPELLLRRFTFKDISKYRTHKDRTLLQFVLGGEDIEFIDMLIAEMLKLPNGAEEISRQIHEQFPEELKQHVGDFDFDKLKAVFDKYRRVEDGKAVNFAKQNPDAQCELNEVIREFQKHFSNEVEITTGRHFNIGVFHDAVKLLITGLYSHPQKCWSSSLCELFALKVISYIVPKLPVSYVQLVFHGLDDRKVDSYMFSTKKYQPIDRSLTIKKITGYTFLEERPIYEEISPLDAKDGDEKLGTDYFLGLDSGILKKSYKSFISTILHVPFELDKEMKVRLALLNNYRQSYPRPVPAVQVEPAVQPTTSDQKAMTLFGAGSKKKDNAEEMLMLKFKLPN
jgi:hypothetical protein